MPAFNAGRGSNLSGRASDTQVTLSGVPASIAIGVPTSGAVVTNTGAGSVNYALVPTAQLSASPSSGTLAFGGSVAITLTGSELSTQVLSVTNASGGRSLGNPISIVVGDPFVPTLTLSGPSAATATVASANFTVVAEDIIASIVVVPTNVVGAATFSPASVSPAPGDLTKLFTATWAVAGTGCQFKAVAGDLESNTVTVDVAPPPPANIATLYFPGTGATGNASTGSVTLNGVAPASGSITISGGAGSTVTPGSLSWTVGESGAAKSFTVAYSGDGTHSISISSGIAGVTVTGSPASHTTSTIAPSAAYRSGQPYLFNQVNAYLEPARVSGGADLVLDSVGAMRDYVDSIGWAWDNPGGDWIDATGARMGSNAWVSMSTPGAGAIVTYSGNCTAALQLVRTAGRWNAWIVSRAPGSTVRTVAARLNATVAYRPRIDVVYTDTTTATLYCRVSAFMGGGTSVPGQTGPTLSMSTAANTGEAALEFDLPTKAVSSATMYFTVTNHWGGSSVLRFNLADPPMNTDPMEQGLAAAYPLDAGITANSNVIFSHRIVDGSSASDFLYPFVDPEGAISWDPALVGGASNTSKLPHVGSGKWIQDWGTGNASIVSSSYTGENFVPLAPGLGALRVFMAKSAGLADGASNSLPGVAAAKSHIYLPIARSGLQRRIFVRYYQRIGSTAHTGSPYRATLAQKYQYIKPGPQYPWVDMGGKCSISAAHKTVVGGNSGSAGGGNGWTMRREFGDYVQSVDSPSAGGWHNALSLYDYQTNNPVGHRYGSGDLPAGVTKAKSFHALGQRGGLGATLYADRWYCIEEEMYLNSVDAPSPTGDGKFWTPDGYMKYWIDGRLVYHQTGLVFRSLPLHPGIVGYQPPVRELGVSSIWFNWFHGGVTANAIDRAVFITGLVISDAYVGPIAQAMPSWVPPAGELTTLTVANGKLANQWRAAVSPNYNAFYSKAIVNDYAGAVKNPYWGTHGCTMWFGSGHASGSNDNSVIIAEYGPTQITFKRIVDPTNWAAYGGINDGSSPSLPDALLALPWLESVNDGKPCSPHSWKTQSILPPSAGGGTYGTFFQVISAAVNHRGMNALAAHKLPLNSMTANVPTWQRASTNSIYPMESTPWSAPLVSVLVPPQKRVYVFANSTFGTVRWFDIDTGAFVTGTGANFENDLSDGGTGGSDMCTNIFYVPTRGLLVMCQRRAGVLKIQWMDVTASQPSLGGTAILSDPALPLVSCWSTATWCRDNSRIIIAGVSGDNSAFYEVEIPGVLTSTWTITRAPLGAGQSFVPSEPASNSNAWGKFEYDEGVKAIVYMPWAVHTGNDTVYVYKPRNT